MAPNFPATGDQGFLSNAKPLLAHVHTHYAWAHHHPAKNMSCHRHYAGDPFTLRAGHNV
jgi:hypothetical protein